MIDKNSILHKYMTDKEIASFSDEELAKFEQAYSFVELVKHLPVNEKEEDFKRKTAQYFGNDASPEDSIRKFEQLSKTDPEYLQQLFASSAFTMFDEQEESEVNGSQKISKQELNNQEIKNKAQEYADLIRKINALDLDKLKSNK